jgi:hypothetical protein
LALRTPAVPYAGVRPVVGLTVPLALHALVFVLASTHWGALEDGADPPPREQTITLLVLRPPEPERSAPEPELRPS